MYKMAPDSVHSHTSLAHRTKTGTSITRISCAELEATMARFGRLTILVAQRDRGGLSTWPSHMFRPDVVVTVNHGDEAARAVAICAAANHTHGWPVLCVVMGAAHASDRIAAAARTSYGSDVQVVIVEGR